MRLGVVTQQDDCPHIGQSKGDGCAVGRRPEPAGHSVLSDLLHHCVLNKKDSRECDPHPAAGPARSDQEVIPFPSVYSQVLKPSIPLFEHFSAFIEYLFILKQGLTLWHGADLELAAIPAALASQMEGSQAHQPT